MDREESGLDVTAPLDDKLPCLSWVVHLSGSPELILPYCSLKGGGLFCPEDKRGWQLIGLVLELAVAPGPSWLILPEVPGKPGNSLALAVAAAEWGQLLVQLVETF